MAEAEPDAVPADGKILDDNATACPVGLIWAQKADEDAAPLYNVELLEGKSSESKKRRAASPAAMPRKVDGVYLKPPVPQGTTRDAGAKNFKQVQRNKKGQATGVVVLDYQPAPQPLGQPATGELTVPPPQPTHRPNGPGRRQ